MATRPRNQGVALVITLAMIALLTFLLVAFFSRAVLNVQIESASTGSARADVLAKSAAEIVVGDFKAEIVAGSSTPPPSALQTVYTPANSVNAVPAVVQAPAIANLSSGSKAVFANLVKQSTDRFFPSGGYYSKANPVIQTVTPVTTDVVTPNGRSVIAKRWDSPDAYNPLGPQLLISPTTPTDSRFTSNTMLPHWVMMTRQGVPAAQTSWVPDWKNYSPSNPNAAIGRFAYNVYDVGGLLDVNVAGYPEKGGATPTVQALGQKGTLGLAQLSLIPGIDTPAGQGPQNATNFTTAWRNLASAGSSNDYLALLGFPKTGTTDLTGSSFFMAGPRNGFLRAAVGSSAADNRLLGRQDLIRLAVKVDNSNGTPSPGAPSTPLHGLTPLSLPYLTHFTREVNAPSWSPATPLGSNMDYKSTAGSKYYPNRAFPGVRVPAGASWKRITGEPVVPGEPLVKYRFPLSWLALLQDADPTTPARDLTPEAIAIVNSVEARRIANGASTLGASNNDKATTLISMAFGLTWDPTNSRWSYSAGTSTQMPTIKLLGDGSTNPANVLADGREPNFFELLKAGILKGSLGNSSDYESFCANVAWDNNADYQVIQIGANIIDQADSDSYPTLIAFGYEYDAVPSLTSSGTYANPTSTPKVFAGVEDVPYLQSILGTIYRRPASQPNLGVNPGDPNQTAARDYLNAWAQFVLWKPQQQSTATSAPTNFRIKYSGSGIDVVYYHPDAPTVFRNVTFGDATTAPVLPSGTTVSFTDGPGSFRIPTLLGGMGTSSSDGFSASQLNGNGGDGTNKPGSQMPRGMWLGETYRPEFIPSPSSNSTAPQTKFTELQCGSQNDSTFELQYQDARTDLAKDDPRRWHTYQRFDEFGMGTQAGFRGRGIYGYADSPTSPMKNTGNPVYSASSPPAYCALDIANYALSVADPRSHRYGLMAMYLDPTVAGVSGPVDWRYYLKQGWAPYPTLTPNYGTFNPSNARFTPNWTGGGQPNPWFAYQSYAPIKDPTTFWADNPTPQTATTPGYNEIDGITGRRRGDGDSTHNVSPMQLNGPPSSPATATANTSALGLVLNRPFRSVGELSYAFRDEPYKTLNLFTSSSGDSGLLDIFSVTDQPALVAGKVNLNTRNTNVLQAVIAGASRDEFATTPNTISAADAMMMATNLVASTTDTSTNPDKGPLLNPSEIANRLAAIVPVGSAPDQAIKARREVVGRALAGSGQTRTWNFLVDIIAQSGRYGPSASKTENFVVEGEKRYWLHVAIDRYTGQVVDQQLEPVME